MNIDETPIWEFVGGKTGLYERLEKIDANLTKEQVPIANRPFRAFDIVCDGSTCVIPLTGSFSDAIRKWYDERYGERTKQNNIIGSIAVIINGAPYRVNFPMAFGKVRYNPLELVVDGTGSLFNTLNEKELISLANLIGGHYQGMTQSGGFWEGIEHLNTAVEHAMNNAFGLSRWESLMSVEKAIKYEIIRLKGKPHKGNKGHNLKALNEQLQECGRSSLCRSDLKVVQCSPSMRYNEVPVSLDDAVAAIHSSSKLREAISNPINRK